MPQLMPLFWSGSSFILFMVGLVLLLLYGMNYFQINGENDLKEQISLFIVMWW